MATEKLREFPALEERRAYLEHALYAATTQSNDAASAGKADPGLQQWLTNIKAELRELRYALQVLTQDNRIEIPSRVVLFGALLLFGILLAQIAILFMGQ